jgi:hypothetical protein
VNVEIYSHNAAENSEMDVNWKEKAKQEAREEADSNHEGDELSTWLTARHVIPSKSKKQLSLFPKLYPLLRSQRRQFFLIGTGLGDLYFYASQERKSCHGDVKIFVRSRPNQSSVQEKRCFFAIPFNPVKEASCFER